MASTILHKVYSCLKERCDAIAVDKKSKSLLYSIISFSATVHDKNFRDTLHFCLKAENMDISIWGYKYVRYLRVLYLMIISMQIFIYYKNQNIVAQKILLLCKKKVSI